MKEKIVKKVKLSNMQEEVDKWMSQFPEGYWPHGDIMMAITEELGEVAREVNHLYGSKKKKKDEKKGNLPEEIGDLLFSITCLATKCNISLDKSFELSMKKKWSRDNYRFKRFNKK